jgi:hypothetical protein
MIVAAGRVIGVSGQQGPPSPGFFASVPSKELIDVASASVDSRGVTGGQVRLKHGKTRCLFVGVASKGVKSRKFKVERACRAGSE